MLSFDFWQNIPVITNMFTFSFLLYFFNVLSYYLQVLYTHTHTYLILLCFYGMPEYVNISGATYKHQVLKRSSFIYWLKGFQGIFYKFLFFKITIKWFVINFIPKRVDFMPYLLGFIEIMEHCLGKGPARFPICQRKLLFSV